MPPSRGQSLSCKDPLWTSAVLNSKAPTMGRRDMQEDKSTCQVEKLGESSAEVALQRQEGNCMYLSV